jgi:50S ribosomal subunit-associated GTPase HflX
MKSADFTREQFELILANLNPMLGYLTRLSVRMDRKGFGDDQLGRDVRKAQRAMQDLRTRLPSLSCIGMGTKRRNSPEAEPEHRSRMP